jgi:hypothetical protein
MSPHFQLALSPTPCHFGAFHSCYTVFFLEILSSCFTRFRVLMVMKLLCSGVLSAMSAMVNLEIPWINVMSKMDLVLPNSEDPSGGGRNGMRTRRNIARSVGLLKLESFPQLARYLRVCASTQFVSGRPRASGNGVAEHADLNTFMTLGLSSSHNHGTRMCAVTSVDVLISTHKYTERKTLSLESKIIDARLSTDIWIPTHSYLQHLVEMTAQIL